MEERQAYYYRIKSDGTICLLKAYGESDTLVIPERIQGKTITEIGSYCFTKNRPIPEDALIWGSLEGLRELSGKDIASVTLPSGLRVLQGWAFFFCPNLREISLPGTIEGIGSDVLLNSTKMCRLLYRHSLTEPGCLKHLLAQIPWDVEVELVSEEGKPQALVFYPEYAEGYDEIGPAHIFSTYIHGEGYRARQSFRDGKIYFPNYDQIFPQACNEEAEKTLCRMAWDRLLVPAELSEKYKNQYENYLKAHQEEAGRQLLADEQMRKERKFAILEELIRRRCLEEKAVDGMIQRASQSGQAELSAALIQWKKQYSPEQKKDRYAFDDWD